MSTRFTPRAWTPIGLAAAMLVGLVGCGGGGGGGEPIVRPVEITLANRDNVAHSAAITMVGVGDALGGVTPSSAVGPGSTAQSLGRRGHAVSALVPATLQYTLQQMLVASRLRQQLVADGMKHALAVMGPETSGCSYGGSTTLTADDMDNNGMLNAGDTVTMVFNGCRELPDARMDGITEMVMTSVSAGQLGSFGARLTMNALSLAGPEHTVTLNGVLLFDYAQTSATVERSTVTVESTLSVQVQGGPVLDTVSMQPGYREAAVYDTAAVPPEGGLPGRASVMVDGTVFSSNLNGTFTISTTQALVAYDIDPFPRAGTVLVQGARGALRMTALSSSQVLLELDADSNGQYENSSTVAWTWLI
jgi:hypothetical protein